MAMAVNPIGKETYIKGQAYLESETLTESEILAKRVAAAVDPTLINVRVIQEGDTLGRIVEGLSQGKIKSEQWKDIPVEYVYSQTPSENLRQQGVRNPERRLLSAHLIFPQQVAGLTREAIPKVIIGDEVDVVVRRIRWEPVAILLNEA